MGDLSQKKIKIGTDIVNISDFVKSLRRGKIDLRNKLFTSYEIEHNPEIASLAGIFAAKEAFIKAVELNISLSEIEIAKRKSGRPFINKPKEVLAKFSSIDISIAHDGDYATATCILITK